jgi:FtsH-binding integral membrane protein
MAKVYGTMGIGLLLTFLVSFFIGTSPGLVQEIFTSAWRWPILLAPLLVILIMSWGNWSATTLKAMFGAFSVLEGISLSVIFVVYTQSSIAVTLLIASAIFGGMSAYGYFTKKDLTAWGPLLMFTLIGLLVAMVVNLFLRNTMMEMLISFAGVILFMGFIAFDSQKIRLDLWKSQDTERSVMMGAVTLYLDMLNLILFLLRIFGVKVPGSKD